MTDDINDLIRALREGTMTLSEVAQRFRERSWPPLKETKAEPSVEWESISMNDPDARVPGSFDDVTAAYYRSEITETQFQVLADAVADAIGRKPTHDRPPES